MLKCKTKSKKTCKECAYLGYCDRANLCDGSCRKCDITDCENNPLYKATEEQFNETDKK